MERLNRIFSYSNLASLFLITFQKKSQTSVFLYWFGISRHRQTTNVTNAVVNLKDPYTSYGTKNSNPTWKSWVGILVYSECVETGIKKMFVEEIKDEIGFLCVKWRGLIIYYKCRWRKQLNFLSNSYNDCDVKKLNNFFRNCKNNWIFYHLLSMKLNERCTFSFEFRGG